MGTSKTNISQLNKYVKGRLNAQDMHQLERESYNDTFLNEALEGYEALPDDDHEEAFALLKNQLHQRAAKSKQRPVIIWRVLPIAASLLVLLGAGYWFLKPEPIKTQHTQATLRNNKRQIAITRPVLQKVTLKKRKLMADANIEPERIKEPEPVLNEVVIAGTPSVKYKADTVEYIASDYKVKSKASVDEILKKAEGFEVSPDGSLSFNGTEVSKARLNGKDYTGGDVAKAIKSLPADIIEKIQVVDDYGDQAGRTGIKSGGPDKVLNLTTAKNSVLNEVVVTGYGVIKKATLAGAVTTIKPMALSTPLVTNQLSEAVNGISDKVQNPTTRSKMQDTTNKPMLNTEVNILNTPKITFKTDTIEYSATDYRVRQNESVEAILKKAEGFEIEPNGAIWFQGRAVKRVKINGKDVKVIGAETIIRNLPADVVDKIEIIDDYSDVKISFKTLEPEKILNFNISILGNTVKRDEKGILKDASKIINMPSPAVGWKTYQDYLDKNAVARGSDGVVVLGFLVAPNGKVSEMKVLIGADLAINKKAVALVKNGAKWRGVSTPQHVRLTIVFRKR